MGDKEDIKQSKIQADDQGIAIGSVDIGGDVSGNIKIGHTIGFTSRQVSALIAQILSTFQPKPFDGRCPYKGLDFFEEVDAELFFGREKLVEDLVHRVKDSRTVFITGTSGSGKSSLVRAGLIYALKRGGINDSHSEGWLYATLKPGREPLEALALAFSRLKSPELATYFRDNVSNPDVLNQCAESALSDNQNQRLVLFIDQFEEVFTQLSAEKADAFIQMITYAAGTENGRVILLFAMRSDFVSNCATYPKLNALLNKQFVQIGAMQSEELVSAIAQPALRVGLHIDPDLIEQIINDMQGEPGALPLMQFALKDLFEAEQAKGGMIALTREAYLQRGGIQKSLERHADASFGKLEKHEQELASSIFGGLIAVGRGTQDTRRTAVFDELIPANSNFDEIQSIVKKLADARLITTDEQAGRDTVTISHEKLIEAWPWLKKLVNENRDVIALQNEIATDAKEWEENKRDKSYLYTGARLANAREQLKAKKLNLSGTSYEFILAGQTRQQRGQWTAIAGILTIMALLVSAVILFSRQSAINKETASTAQAANTLAVEQAATAQAANTLAVANEQEAIRQAQISRAGELAAQSTAIRERNFPLSLLLAIESFNLKNTPQSRGALLDNTYTNPHLLRYLLRHDSIVTSVAFSPDGTILASANADGAILLMDTNHFQPIKKIDAHNDAITKIVFSPNGRILASAGRDQAIHLWDMNSYQPIGQPLIKHNGTVTSIAFSPNGETLASGSEDQSIILWDVQNQLPISEPLTGSEGRITNITFSPDGETLVSGSEDGRITVWDTQDFSQFTFETRSYIYDTAFEPNSNILAIATCGMIGDNGFCSQGKIILWDIATRQTARPPLIGHGDFINNIAFSPDGKMLASGSWDKTIILWDTENYQPLGKPLYGHTSNVNSISFSPDSKLFASGGGEKSIILWSVKPRQPIGQQYELKHQIFSATISPDGKHFASGSENAIFFWDLTVKPPTNQSLINHSGIVNALAFSPDNKFLASGSHDNKIILWDVESNQPIGEPLNGHEELINALAFSPDGKILASGSWDDQIILWDVSDPNAPVKTSILSGESEDVISLAFSPDGKILASGYKGTELPGDIHENAIVILWNVETKQPIGQPLTNHSDSVNSVVFSPDGKYLFSGSWDKTIIQWDVDSLQPISEFVGHLDYIYTIAVSADGTMLASGSSDKTIILWDIETRQPIGQPLTLHNGEVISVSFSNDDKILMTSSWDDTVIFWSLEPLNWIKSTCQRVERNFTQTEWGQYFPDEPYRIMCPQWPAGE